MNIDIERKKFIKLERLSTVKVIFFQILILILFITLWQILSDNNIINSFLCSSPKKVIITIINLISKGNLITHVFATLKEIFICFFLGLLIGLLISTILWWCPFISKVFDPYITILNSLPKVAIGPIIIIWAGANQNSIILMSLLISIFTAILNIYFGFKNTNKTSINLLKSFGANKYQIFKLIVLPSNINTVIGSLKINLSLTFVGVIMGELLVSKEGLGYLINYGSQVFNTDLVIASVIILCILTSILYYILLIIELKTKKNDFN